MCLFGSVINVIYLYEKQLMETVVNIRITSFVDKLVIHNTNNQSIDELQKEVTAKLMDAIKSIQDDEGSTVKISMQQLVGSIQIHCPE